MTFLNATLLFGSIAVLIPIAFHLLGRKEPKRIPFPAVRFLTNRLQSNRRRMRVKRWVLLAMRVFLLALLALAFAQPQIHRATLGTWLGIGGLAGLGLTTLGLAIWAMLADRPSVLRWGLLIAAMGMLLAAGGWGATTIASGPRAVVTATAPAAVVFLMDNGPTSGYGRGNLVGSEAGDEEAGNWRLGRARQTAEWLLGRYPQESRFAVVDRSARPATFALDAAAVQRNLQSVEPLQTTRPLSERIEAAVRLLRTSELPRKTLYILTDLTTSSWNASETGISWPTLAAEVGGDPEVTVQVVDIGEANFQNKFLGDVELSDPTPARNVASPISILVERELGLEDEITASRDVTVQLRIFEQQPGLPLQRESEIEFPKIRTVDRKSVGFGSRPVRVDLTLPPLDFGTHHGLLEIVGGDALSIDNTRYFTVRVEPPVKVLLVCDAEPERKVLAAMLNPYGMDDARREYEIDFATDKTLRDMNLADYEVIGLFNPRLPPTLVRDELDVWVRGGGQLFAAIGTALDGDGTGESIEWPLVGNPKRIWRIPEPGTFAQLVQSGHPSLAALASAPGGAPWSAFRVYHYWQLGDDSGFSELLRYAGTEHVELGERSFDRGRVLLLTTPLPAILPPADRWNDLLSSSLSGAWDVYVILLRYIFEDLSGGLNTQLNASLGEPVVLTVQSESTSAYQLFAPGQPPVQIDVSQQSLVPGIPTVAGNYWLRGTGREAFGFSANMGVGETRLARITEADLDQVLGAGQYQLVKDREEIQLAEGEADQARSLYPLLMLLVAGIFMLEQLLANRFYPNRDKSEKSKNTKRTVAGEKQTVVAA